MYIAALVIPNGEERRRAKRGQEGLISLLLDRSLWEGGMNTITAV